MAKYSDLDFFLNKNTVNNDIKIKTEIDSVAQSVKNIILTDTGEKMFSPFFGGGIPNLLFETLDWREIILVKEQLKTTLRLYEPRILVKSINIQYTGETKLSIELTFSLITEPITLRNLTIEI